MAEINTQIVNQDINVTLDNGNINTQIVEQPINVSIGGAVISGLAQVTSDSTLSGDGTTSSPLSVVDHADIGLNSTHRQGDGSDHADVATNTVNVAQNSSDISQNASDILTNAGNIAINTSDISTNQTNISTNASNIATNVSGIATNAGDITDLQNDKADKVKVLELDNTTPYTPTLDYHPMTLKYFEDNVPAHSPVTSVFGRTGNVIAVTGDYTWNQIDKTSSSIGDITNKSHLLLDDIGSNSHANIDTHISDSTIHFTETSIDHTVIANVGTQTHTQIDAHIASSLNPHSVTKAQVGLGNADNTSDLNKPISTATQTALDTKLETVATDATITGDGTVGSPLSVVTVGGVTSVFGRTGAVVAQNNDYTWAQIDKTISDISDITTRSHLSLTDIGTNTHTQIDTHIADSTIHFTEASISIPHTQISDYDTELAGTLNVTPFTPSADYHVATKKYVDDSITAEDFWQRNTTILSPQNAGDSLSIDAGATFNTVSGDNDFIVNSITGIALQYDMGNSRFGVGRAPTQEFDFYSADGGEMDFLIENGSSGEMKLRLKNPTTEWEINNTATGDFSIKNNTVDGSQPVIYINESIGIERLRFTASTTIFNNDNYDIDLVIKAPRQLLCTGRSVTDFTVGETITGSVSGATGTVRAKPGNQTSNLITYEKISGTFIATEVVTGGTSGATATVNSNYDDPSAYYYNTGNSNHGWGRSPSTDFDFFKRQGGVDFRVESGDVVDQTVEIELINFSQKWQFGMGSDGDFRIRNSITGLNTIEITNEATAEALFCNANDLRFNDNYTDLDVEFRKLTTGKWIDYDCGTDNLNIDAVNLDLISPNSTFYQATGNVDVFIETGDASTPQLTLKNSVNNYQHQVNGIGDYYMRKDGLYNLLRVDTTVTKSELMRMTGSGFVFNYGINDYDFQVNYQTSGQAINVDANSAVKTITLGSDADAPRLTTQPTGTVDLAIATTKYVKDAVLAEDFWQRNTTTLSPQNAGDSLSIDGGLIVNSDNGDNDIVFNQQTITASITAFADGGGGEVTATATAHGFGLGDTVTITGTTNYDGSYTINAVTANDFDFTATFVATETGTATVDKDAYIFDAGLRQHRFDGSNADFLIQSTSANQPATLFLESTADTETEIQMKGILSDWKMNLTRGDFAIAENGVGEKFAIDRLGTVSGQWLFLETGQTTFNKGFDDRDFVVNKLTSGVAYQYSADTDQHGWGRAPTSDYDFYKSTGTVNLNIETAGANDVDLDLTNSVSTWTIRNKSGGNFTLYRAGNEIIQVTDSVSAKVFNAKGSGVVFNASNDDFDFSISKNVSGTAYKYDASLHTHVWDGETTFNNSFEDADFIVNNLTSGEALKIDAGLKEIQGDFILMDSAYNIIWGKESCNRTLTGSANIINGRLSAQDLTTGSSNVLSGYAVAVDLQTGSNNVITGREGGKNLPLGASGSVMYGHYAGYYETGSNKFFIDNQLRTDEATSRLNSLMYGELSATRSSQNLYLNSTVNTAENFVANYTSGDVDFTINSSTGTAYKFDNGTSQHGWGRTPTVDFDFYKPTGTIDFNIVTGGANSVDLNLANSVSTWTIRNENVGNFTLYRAGNEIIQITDSVSAKIFNAEGGGVAFNANNDNFNFSIGKLTTGQFLNYDAGLDSATIDSPISITNGNDLTLSNTGYIICEDTLGAGTIAFGADASDRIVIGSASGNLTSLVFKMGNTDDAIFKGTSTGFYQFNSAYRDRNFIVRKKTSGEFLNYDSGLDIATINSEEINLYSPTSTFTLNMRNGDGTGQLWQMYFTGGNDLTINDGTDDRIVMANSGAGGQWLDLSGGQITTNYSYKNQDFVIRSDTTGIDAYKYDAGNVNHTWSGGLVRDRETISTTTATLDKSQHIISVDASSNTVTITLDVTPVDGQEYQLKCVDATNLVTIVGTIDGATNVTMNQYDSLRLMYNSDTTEWEIR